MEEIETTEIVDETVDEDNGAEIVDETVVEDTGIKVAVPTAKSVKSLTNGDWFANYGTADLRAHLRFWKNEDRSKGAALELANKDERFATMKREDHIRMLEEEIAARDAARSKGGPTG